MKTYTPANIHFNDSIHRNIEVQIVFNQEGAPYCEFIPSAPFCEFLPSWKLMPTSAFFLGDPQQPSDYLMSDGGYPESYPKF